MKRRVLAKLFNSSEIKKVAKGNFTIFSEVSEIFPELTESKNVTEFYSLSYALLLKKYRNEYVVKNEIVNKVLLGRYSLNTTAMMSEIRTGSSIADCLVVNGYSTCYEIKTEFDSLSRLMTQLKSYLKAYDKTYVVTHRTHLEAITAIHADSPQFGIIELTKRNQLKTIVEAPIIREFDFNTTFDTLRKAEYTYIAKQVSGEIPDMPNTQVYDYCRDCYFSLSAEDANHMFKESLKKFRNTDHSFINQLPRSLKNVGISYQLSRNEKNSLLCLLMNNTSLAFGENHVLPISARKAS